MQTPQLYNDIQYAWSCMLLLGPRGDQRYPTGNKGPLRCPGRLCWTAWPWPWWQPHREGEMPLWLVYCLVVIWLLYHVSRQFSLSLFFVFASSLYKVVDVQWSLRVALVVCWLLIIVVGSNRFYIVGCSRWSDVSIVTVHTLKLKDRLLFRTLKEPLQIEHPCDSMCIQGQDS